MNIKISPDKNRLWFPSLLQVSNNINSNSWFNILQKKNNNQSFNNVYEIDTLYTKTMKYMINIVKSLIKTNKRPDIFTRKKED